VIGDSWEVDLGEPAMLTQMTDADWGIVVEAFRAARSHRGDKGRDDRKFLEAVHNITWRALPAEFGNWNNLSVRMAARRFTRLTNGFSKKLANHVAAVSRYVAHFNLCRVHESLRITPAMAMGITDHIWTIGELIDAATAEPMEQQAA
jgi:hypothetical protein